MNSSRRRLLAGAGGLVAALAGCLSSAPGGPGGGASESPDETTSTRTATTETATTETTTEETPQTTAADYPETVEVTTTVDRDGLKYVESNDTVRYVAYLRTDRSGETPTREPIYEHISFDEWAETECASAAAKRVNEVMAQRLGGDADGISAGITAEDGERVVFVAHQTLLNRDGEVISEPSVSYERVERVAPERVEVTLSFAGRTRECTVAVTTREETIQQQ